MLMLGVSAKAAQRRLGHSTYAVTMDTYSHVLEEVELDASEKLEAGLRSIMV
jgi:integrase